MNQILSDVLTMLIVVLVAWLVYSVGRASGRTDRDDDLDEAATVSATYVADLEATNDLLLQRLEELRDQALFAEVNAAVNDPLIEPVLRRAS